MVFSWSGVLGSLGTQASPEGRQEATRKMKALQVQAQEFAFVAKFTLDLFQANAALANSLMLNGPAAIRKRAFQLLVKLYALSRVRGPTATIRLLLADGFRHPAY